MHTFQMQLGGRLLTVESGKMAKQASGSVLVRYGDTAVLVAATASAAPREGIVPADGAAGKIHSRLEGELNHAPAQNEPR